MTRVTMSPSAEARGVAILSRERMQLSLERQGTHRAEPDLPGLTLYRRHSTTNEHMKLPNTPLLILAASMLTQSTSNASKYPPRSDSSTPPLFGL